MQERIHSKQNKRKSRNHFICRELLAFIVGRAIISLRMRGTLAALLCTWQVRDQIDHIIRRRKL